MKLAKEAYGWPTDSEFLIPDEALARFRESVERGREWEREWNERRDAYRERTPSNGRSSSR